MAAECQHGIPACIRINRVPGKLCSGGSGSDQQHFPSCRSDQWASGIEQRSARYVDCLPSLLMREAGFWRRSECLRTDEIDD
ncbi:hypothetical protein KCP71_04545 [Salmonella enterica subsp. enterica]|nr:hypothetical protein KCP71_04545 [Salmonella enterica subsp. enterica]